MIPAVNEGILTILLLLLLLARHLLDFATMLQSLNNGRGLLCAAGANEVVLGLTGLGWTVILLEATYYTNP